MKADAEEIDWPDFSNAATAFVLIFSAYSKSLGLRAGIAERAVAGAESIMIMQFFRKYRQDHQQGVPLAKLLLQSVDFECSDSRDSVYGLLALSTAGARDYIDPLYHAEIGEAYVSMVATRFCLQQEASFKLLELSGIGYPQLEEQRPVQRPSWVPRSNLFHVTKTKMWVLRSEKYETATHLSCNVLLDATYPGLLEMEGSFIDRVRHMAPMERDRK